MSALNLFSNGNPPLIEESSAPQRGDRLRYQHLISSGVSESLSAVMFHDNAPVRRRRMFGQEIHPQANSHIAVHEIRGVAHSLDRRYCQPHSHNCSELNLIFSFERLVFRVTLGGEEYICKAPTSIFIPAGVRHSANVVEGTGFFVVMLGCGEYRQSLTGGTAPKLNADSSGVAGSW